MRVARAAAGKTRPAMVIVRTFDDDVGRAQESKFGKLRLIIVALRIVTMF
jgi:hypothetical protein